jgi:hypothetical protein
MTAPPPLDRNAVVDRYFLEHRAKLIDLAAYLDRYDRARPGARSGDDPRHAALLAAMAILLDGRPDRARRVLEHLSDPTTEPIPLSPGKGAIGAFVPNPA